MKWNEKLLLFTLINGWGSPGGRNIEFTQKILNIFLIPITYLLFILSKLKEAKVKLFSHYEYTPLVSLFYCNQDPEAASQSPKGPRLHISGPYMNDYDTLINSQVKCNCICSSFKQDCSTTFVNFYILNLDLIAPITWSLPAIVYYYTMGQWTKH